MSASFDMICGASRKARLNLLHERLVMEQVQFWLSHKAAISGMHAGLLVSCFELLAQLLHSFPTAAYFFGASD